MDSAKRVADVLAALVAVAVVSAAAPEAVFFVVPMIARCMQRLHLATRNAPLPC